jgi:hypothetical protein
MRKRTIALSIAALLWSAPLVHGTPADIWSQRFGGTDDVGFREIAVDPSGNIVAIGYFYDQVTLDSTYTTLGYKDVFVAKFDANGNPIWSRQVADVSTDQVFDVTTDRVGNVIAVGYLAPSSTDIAAMVVKYAPDGTLRWLKRYGDGDDKTQAVECVTTDYSKNLIIAGEFDGSIDLGGGPLLEINGRTVFLAKLDQLGNHVWSKRFATTSGIYFFLAGMQTGADGQTTLYGMIDGSIDFGNGALTTAGGYDVFLAKFDPNGNVIWAHNYGDAGNQYAGTVAINESAQIAIAGYTSGDIDLGGGVLTPTGGPDPFVAVLTPGGNHVWSKIFTGALPQWGMDVTWASNQDVVLLCRGYGTLDFGGGPLAIAGTTYQLYLARFLGSNGDHRWSTMFSSTGGMEGYIEEDDGHVLLGGGVYGDVDFGAGVSPGTTLGDAFLAGLGDILTGASSPVVSATLEQNAPNPFNPQTTINYTLDAPARAEIVIYDASGAVVARLDDGVQPTGAHSITWDGRDGGGKPVASGVYFYRLEGLQATGARKMVLLK